MVSNPVKNYMRNIFLCAVTFGLTLTLADALRSGGEGDVYIDHKAFRLMECEHLIDMDGNEVSPHEGCTFGGHYPRSHPLDYETWPVEIVNSL